MCVCVLMSPSLRLGAIDTPSMLDGCLKPLRSGGACTPTQFAESALNLFPTSLSASVLYVPYWLHWLQFTSSGLLPQRMRAWVLNQFSSSMKEKVDVLLHAKKKM